MFCGRDKTANKVHSNPQLDTALGYITERNINEKNADGRRFYVRLESPGETKDNYAFEQEQMTAMTANLSFTAFITVGVAPRLKCSIPVPLARNPQFAFIARCFKDKHVMLF